MRPPIAGNWKMHGMAPQLAEIEAIAALVKAIPPSADILICVPATLIARAAQTAAGRIAVGGEDCSAEIAGAFTGDTSAEMLKGAGAAAIIVGHSERRQHHAETDAIVAAKAKTAQRGGFLAIICIGETQSPRGNGNALAVCADQLAGSIPDNMTTSAIAIGYELLWAIGSGTMPTHNEIVEVMAHVRAALEERFGGAARSIRILYGGSVKPGNAREFLDTPDVDGVLIGGASLLAAEVNAIVDLARGRAPTRCE